MEVYLGKGKVTFNNKYIGRESNADIITERYAPLEEPLLFGSVTSANCVGELIEDNNSGGNSFQLGFIQSLCDWGEAERASSKSLSFNVILTMTSTKTAQVQVLNQGWMEVQNGPNEEPQVFPIFERLVNSTFLPSYELNLNLSVNLSGTKFEANGKNLEIVKFEGNGYGVEMAGIKITEDLWSKWDYDNTRDADDDDGDADMIQIKKIEFEGEMTLTLRLEHSAVSKLYMASLATANVCIWPGLLINEEVDSDLVILAGGEKDKENGLKCQKKILSARSPVFTAMFQPKELSEVKDNCLEIMDMTKAGVSAMLLFIYVRDLEEASKNSEISVELLEAGHKYGMEDLVDAMMHLIWVKPVEWVSVDLALKMVRLGRNIGGKFEKVEKTGFAILKWYAQKSGSLMKWKQFESLFLEHPETALELAASFLKI